MFRKLTIAKPEGFNKTNLKILKIISIILAILILICLVLLVVGFIKKFTDISEHQEQEKLEKITTIKNNFEKMNYIIYQPKNSQLISSSIGSDGKLLLRYQFEGKNFLLVINLISNLIEKKIEFISGDDWMLEAKDNS